MDVWFYYYYYGLYFWAILTNLLLIYSILRVVGFCAKACLMNMLNQILSDFLICTVLVLLVPRRIPVGNNLVVFSYGFCGMINESFCQVLNIMWLILLAQNIMAMTVSFFYRYYVLYHTNMGVKSTLTTCAIPYLIGLPFLVLGESNIVTGEALVNMTALYNIEIPENTVNFGYQDYRSIRALLVHVYTLYLTPLWCVIMFCFRYKVVNFLDNGCTLSKQTIGRHRTLVLVLTVQACLPILHFLNIIGYFLEQSHLLHVSDFSYLTFLMGIHFTAANGGFVFLCIVKPYREEVVHLFRRVNRKPSAKTVALGSSLVMTSVMPRN